MIQSQTLPSLLSSAAFEATHVAEPSTGPALRQLAETLKPGVGDALILFTSDAHDLDQIATFARDLERSGTAVLCCTTAGEVTSVAGYTANGMAGAIVRHCQCTTITIDLGDIDAGRAAVVEAGAKWSDTVDAGTVGLLVCDGLSLKEEAISRQLQLAVPTIPIVGGSAGQSQKQGTHVFDGQAMSQGCARLLLMHGPFEAMSFHVHHFLPSGRRVVATDVELDKRVVKHLDGKPARQRLAEVFDVPEDQVTFERMALSPLLLRHDEDYYARSVQSVNDDGSLTMYCQIGRGQVLHLGRPLNMADLGETYRDAMHIDGRRPDLTIGFDCILRRLEFERRNQIEEMGRLVSGTPFVGFSTFGEQVNGQHVNQTMTGVALWTR